MTGSAAPFAGELDAVLTILLLALGITIAATPAVARFAFRFGAVDAPGGRHAHAQPTPSLGGLAVMAGVMGGILTAAGTTLVTITDLDIVPILGVAGLVFLLGAMDDVFRISPTKKLAGLGLAAGILVAAGVEISFIELPGLGPVHLGWLAAPATVVWILAATNAVNLIDGVDGVGPGVVTIAAGGLALLSLGLGDASAAILYGATCGASAGFLLFNRPPASIFLGDSGSLSLGFLLAGTAAMSCRHEPTAILLLGALLALGVPFLDAGQSFCRRFRARRKAGGSLGAALAATAVADRGHIHHRLLDRHGSARRVVLVLALVTAINCLVGLLLLSGDGSPVTALAAGVVSALVLTRLAACPPAATADVPETDATQPSTPDPNAAVAKLPRARTLEQRARSDARRATRV